MWPMRSTEKASYTAEDVRTRDLRLRRLAKVKLYKALESKIIYVSCALRAQIAMLCKQAPSRNVMAS